jgi:hypothetical protein
MDNRGVQPEDFSFEEKGTYVGGGGSELVRGNPLSASTVISPSGRQARSISFSTEDIVALGALVLCIAAGVVALVIAMALAFRTVDGNIAVKIILGCVGSGAVASVVAKLSLGGKKKN